MEYVNIEGEKGNIIYISDGRYADTLQGIGMNGECFYDRSQIEADRDYWKFLYECEKHEYNYTHNLLNETCKALFGSDMIDNGFLWYDKIYASIKNYLDGNETSYIFDEKYSIV